MRSGWFLPDWPKKKLGGRVLDSPGLFVRLNRSLPVHTEASSSLSTLQQAVAVSTRSTPLSAVGQGSAGGGGRLGP